MACNRRSIGKNLDLLKRSHVKRGSFLVMTGALQNSREIARLLMGVALTGIWRIASAPLRWPLAALQSQPQSLIYAPQDIRTADPTIAEDIYAGYFNFTGKIIKVDGQSPFEIVPPSVEWARRLHSFGWLRHLRAADTALSRMNARALVEDWLNLSPKFNHPLIWDPEVAARRLKAWLSQSPLILEGADNDFYRRFMRAVSQHMRFLRRRLAGGLAGLPRLVALLALTEAALCVDNMAGLQKAMSRTLMRELSRQIQRDGGHLSRNPRVLIELMLDLLPLRQLYIVRGLSPPDELQTTMDRILPMLRMFRHSNGELALFHGTGESGPDTLATLFAYEDTYGNPIMNADISGYQRAEAGESVLIMDTGAAPSSLYSSEAHASALSFEFSSGACKIITNCGAAERHRADFRAASRLTAAHSALVYAGHSSALFLNGALASSLGKRIIDGPRHVEVITQADPQGFTIRASHDGYRHARILHRRSLTLAPSGQQIIGLDEILPSKSQLSNLPLSSLRFHLDPATRAQRSNDPTRLQIVLADGNVWEFAIEHENPEIEESIVFADPSGPRRSLQIAVHTSAPEIRWSLTHLGALAEETPDQAQ